jgi:hypothetical protein
MAERRGAGLLNQKTLSETPPPPPPEGPPPATPPAAPPEESPRPVVYPSVAPSSDALHERQLRWLRLRDHRAAGADSPTLPDES